MTGYQPGIRCDRTPPSSAHLMKYCLLTLTSILLAACSERPFPLDYAPEEMAPQLATSSGTTYYVDPDGSDTNDGLAPERAWRTVAKVNGTTFVPGDRVLFQGGGVWREMLEPRGSGSADAPITFGAYGEGRPVLDGQSASGYAGIVVGARQYLVFRDFEVRNRSSGNLIYLAGASRILFDGVYVHAAATGFHVTPSAPASDITILNSRIENTHTGTGGIGINVTAGSTRWTVKRTTISRAGDSCIIDTGSNSLYEEISVRDCGFSTMPVGTHGLYLKGPGHTLLNSEVWNTRDSCVSVRFPGIRVQGNHLHGCEVGVSWFEGTGGAGEVVVTRNTIWNAHTGIYVDGSTTQTFRFSHNTIVGLRAGGEQNSRGIWVHPVPGLFIENNLVTGAVDVPLHVKGNVSTYVERANVFHSSIAARFHWGAGFTSYEEYRTASGQSTGSTTVDPQLVRLSLENPDFRLQPSSPVLGMGVLDPSTGTLVRGCSGAPNEYCGAGPEPGAYEVLEENAPPAVTSITLPADPVAVNVATSISASFTDANPGDAHTATVDWGSETRVGTVNSAIRTVTGSYTYTKAGVYTISVTVNDGVTTGSRSSALDIPAYIVVYDPSAGFVTGGGWIDSPERACRFGACSDATTGRATFGFVSRYKAGATTPSGNTEFQFKAGGLHFKSTSYQWLVVAGARAQYKGEGRINGGGDYGFLLTAIDGQVSGGGGTDRFRIKIWNKDTDAVVYDNQLDQHENSDAATAIGGGSIVIHKQ